MLYVGNFRPNFYESTPKKGMFEFNRQQLIIITMSEWYA